MRSLPIAFTSVMGIFAPVFSRPVWQHVTVLLTGAVLAPGKRTVTAMLQIMGLSTASDVQTYHRVLNRAIWSPLTASRLLLRLVVAVFVPRGVVIFGLDDTIERRRGHQIQAKGIDRDPVRSSHAQVVNVSGLRWLAWMVLTPLSWANRVWALPFLTVLCPSERFYEPRGRRHQTLTERAWQMMRLVVRWWPGRELACVADSCFAALELLDKVKTWPRARVITRLRLDAALDDPSPPREPGTKGRPRPKARTALLRKLKPIFRRHRSGPLRGFIEEINPILRGWVQYFAFGHSSQCFSYVRRWVEQQVRRHLATARKRPGFGWKRWSRRWLYDSMGLFAAYRVTYRPSTSAAPVG